MTTPPATHARAPYVVYLVVSLACIGLLALAVVAIVPIDDWLRESRDDRVSLANLADHLGAAIPPDAVDVQYTTEGDPPDAISLTFRAPPDSLTNFTPTICEGVLHPGYDPFDAVDAVGPEGSTVLIKAHGFTYYSHSPDAPMTVAGNRCVNSTGHVHQIRVDRSDLQLHAVRFEQTDADDSARKDVNYIVPDHDIPFMVMGMTHEGDVYRLVTREFCVETRFDYRGYQEYYKRFAGANVTFMVDGESLLATHMNDAARLAAPNAQKQDRPYTNYCYLRRWTSGSHTMQVRILTLAGEEWETEWTLEVP